MLLQIYPKAHQWHKAIFFDTDEKQYYNARTDIYLCDEDISHFKLRPIELINIPLPEAELTDYFTVWNRLDSIKMKIVNTLNEARTKYQLTNLSNDMIDTIAYNAALICKYSCPSQTWNNQSPASTTQD